MTTFYLDPENGNDANDGTTFANRWKTLTNGATDARIASGDVIRVISAPEPTLVGDATFYRGDRISSVAPPTAYSISAVSNTTPIEITTSASHGLSTGDVVKVYGQSGNRYVNGFWVVTVVDATKFTLNTSVAAGSGGTATGLVQNMTKKVILLDTAVNKTIDMCEVVWTGSSNVTATIQTSSTIQGDRNVQLSILSAFSSGKVAYRTLPATIDLSAYQQVSLMLWTNVNISSGLFTLRLCSDTTGDTAVNTLTIPASQANGSRAITINNGAALGSSIASIALYAESDPGVIGVRLDCIIACKAPGDDALSLTSLITKNRAGDSCYSISSIEDRVLVLDGGNTSVVTTAVDQYGKHFGWWEATETVSLYKREPIPSPTDASNNYTINDNGITISGGWNRTDMSTQSGETWIDGFRTYSGFIISAKNNITIEDIALTRFNGSISISGANSNNLTLTNFTQNAITSTGINVGSIAANQPSKITFNGYIRSIGCRNTNATSGINTTDAFGGYTIPLLDFSNCEVFCHGGGTFLTISGVDNVVFDVINCYESYTPLSVTTTSNVYIDVLNVVDSFLGMICNNGGFIRVRQCTIDYADYAVFVSRGQNSIKIQDYSDTNLLYVVYHTLGLSVIEVQNFDSSFVTGLYGTANPSNTYFSQMQLRLGNYGGVSTDHRTYFSYAGEILSETSVRHTASGYAWKMTPETTLFDTVQTAIKMLVGKVYVEASKVVTVTGWVRRTHTDIKIGLIAFKSQLAGMTADYSDEITAAIDTWEELSFTFTPTEAGVVEIYAYCYGSLTESGYVDDIDITQAA